ncbi:MAG: tetratricopeptide repeat protein [Polyangiaceae bacterium]|nr:tetratricopeptide repeat protein [Polyangiaceae bacterium]
MRLARPWLVLAALALVASSAHAAEGSETKKKKSDDAAAEAKKPAGPKTDPKGITGVSPFMDKLAKGQKLVVARDFPGAIAAFREAITEDPKNALGHLYLGSAQLLKGDLVEADASLQTALRDVGPDDALRAKVTFAIADLRERQRKWDDAKGGWDTYQKDAERPKAKGFPDTGKARREAIDKWLAAEKAAGPVKDRIAARLKEQEAATAKDAQKDADAHDKKPRK